MIPTRSRVERWTAAINELHASSAAWQMAALQTESASDGVFRQMSNPGGSQWMGAAADAAQEAAHSDRATAYRSSEIMRALAERASSGADDIQSHHRSVLDYISTIESDGFIVGEDLSVIDNEATADPIAAAQRQILAEEHRGVLTYRAGALAEADAEVATALNAGAAELVGTVPATWSQGSQASQASEGSPGSGIQLVDWKTDKPDLPPDFPSPDAQTQTGPTPQIGPYPVPPSVKEHEPPLPPPAPPTPVPPWQKELDVLKDQLAQQGQTIEDLQEAGTSPSTAGVLTAIGGGCASAAVPTAIAGAVTGPIDGPLTAGACVVGSAAGLTSYLAGIWITNAVG